MEDRIVDLEKAIGKIEIYMESMSESIHKMAETMSDYKVIADRTTQNGSNIEKLFEMYANLEKETRAMCDGHSRRHTDNMKDVRVEITDGDDKLYRASENRFRWGMGISIMLTLSLFGTSIKMINDLDGKLDKRGTQNYYIEKKLEELIELEKKDE